jgi:DNA polymerase III subunit delta'
MSTTVQSPWDVPGQDAAVAAVRGAVARGEVSHAWALLGPVGVGQQELARALTAALNCTSALRTDADPCGACDVCDRCLRGVFPSYFEFAPAGAMHRVAEVRDQWLHTAARTATEGRYKVLRIIDADRMNDAAANAFLKGLEEPPPGTVWILDVSDPDELPDTILSRCRSVRLMPWGPAALDAEARRLGLDDEADRRLAVRAALGSPVSLRRIAAPGGLKDLRAHRSIPARLREDPAYALVAAHLLGEEVKRRTTALKAEGKAELEELGELYGDQLPRGVAKQLEERAARREREARTVVAQGALDDLVGWLRDCLLVGAGGDPSALVHGDAAEQARQDAEALGPATILRAIDLVLATREQLELNLQQGLALEALFMDLAALSLQR